MVDKFHCEECAGFGKQRGYECSSCDGSGNQKKVVKSKPKKRTKYI